MNFTRKRGVCSARCLLILCLPILSSSVVAAQTATQATLPAETRIQIENAVSKFMATTSAPGIAVAVVMNGEEVWSEGFGMADLENSVPVAPQTLFRLASVSKPITATAAMELWERHQLDLDAPVQKYCPAFPKKEFPISTRQLLGHLGEFGTIVRNLKMIWKAGTRSTSTIRSWGGWSFSRMTRWLRSRGLSSIIRRRGLR